MKISDTDYQLEPVKKSQATYKSKIKVSFMCWVIAMATFHNGYWMVYVQQIKIDTLKDIFNIDLQSGVTAGLLNGCIPVGAFIGAFFNSNIAQRLSRRKSLLFINLLALIAGVMIFIRDFNVLIACRLIQGFCVGNYSATVPSMIRQLSPMEIAGFLGSFVQLNICLGSTVAYLLPYVLQLITGDQSGQKYWYYTFGLPLLTIAIQTLILLFILTNQTPKYLLSKGKVEEARKSIGQIYKQQFIQYILQQKIKDLSSSQGKQKSEAHLIKFGNLTSYDKFQIMIAIHLGLLLQFSGINAVVVYGGKIAKTFNYGEYTVLVPLVFNLNQIFGLLVSSILLLKLGRRSILLCGIIGLATTNAIILTAFLLEDNRLVVLGLLAFMFIFGLSLGPVIWIYFSQIVQRHNMFYAVGSNWIGAACVIILFPILTDNLLNGNPALLFIFFTAWSLFAFLFSYRFVIQTKDKTQKQIKEDYQALRICS